MKANKAQKAETSASEKVADVPTPSTVEQSEIGFITSDELSRRLNCSVGTIQNWRKKGFLPWVATPGRSVRFHWPTVESTLLRMQRGG